MVATKSALLSTNLTSVSDCRGASEEALAGSDSLRDIPRGHIDGYRCRSGRIIAAAG